MTHRTRLSAYLLIPITALLLGFVIGGLLFQPNAEAQPWPAQPQTADRVLICFDRTGHPTTGSDWAECKTVKL